MKLNKHKLIYIWPQLKYLKIQLKIPQSDYINFKNYGEKNETTLISGLIVRTRPDRS